MKIINNFKNYEKLHTRIYQNNFVLNYVYCECTWFLYSSPIFISSQRLEQHFFVEVGNCNNMETDNRIIWFKQLFKFMHEEILMAGIKITSKSNVYFQFFFLFKVNNLYFIHRLEQARWTVNSKNRLNEDAMTITTLHRSQTR